jgi:hypothetical protein
MWPFSRPKPSLASVLRGRELTAFFLDDDAGTARLRFSDSSALAADLDARTFKRVPADQDAWLSLPGWVRIVNVVEDASQVILVVSGAIYTARISFRNSRGRWRLILSGGRVL